MNCPKCDADISDTFEENDFANAAFLRPLTLPQARVIGGITSEADATEGKIC